MKTSAAGGRIRLDEVKEVERRECGSLGPRCPALGPFFRPQHGFTYLGVLFLVVVIGVALTSVATVWHTAITREKEAELLFIGDQFRAAIEDYYRVSPGTPQFPMTLQDLLEDKRFPYLRRHLRKLYVDPMTGRDEWGLQRLGDGGGIVGVYSLSDRLPIKQENFDTAYASFAQAKTYRDWVFAFQSDAPPSANQPPAAPAGSTPMQPLESVPLQPGPISAGPIAAPTAPRGTDATRQARERMCQVARRADIENCRIAQMRNGIGVSDRCNMSVDLRSQACLEPGSQGVVPLDTGAS